MKELFERLVKAWPKDSQWKITKHKTRDLHWVDFMLYGSGMGHTIYAEGMQRDLESAVALTIIRQELVKRGFNYVHSVGIGHGNIVSVTHNEFHWSFCNDRDSQTAATLETAVEAFEALQVQS